MPITYDEYLDNALNGRYGQGVDMDGAFGYQCWDLGAHYAREVAGSQPDPYLRTYTTRAKDIFIHFGDGWSDGRPINETYFTAIANEHGNPNQLPLPGDLIVADGNDGHVALVIAADGNGIDVLEQWGGTPSVGFQRTVRSWSSMSWLGWLRPKRDIRSVPLQPYQRIVTSDGGNAAGREFPRRTATKLQELTPGQVADLDAVCKGQVVDGNEWWGRGKYQKRWFSMTVFTDSSLTGLPVIDNPENAPNQPPVVVTPEPLPPYEFAAFSPVIDRVVPAHRSNFQIGHFPASPEKIVMHDFGTRGLHTLGSLINTFTGDHTNDEDAQVSCHIAVGIVEPKVTAFRVDAVQLVSLADRAWGSGPKGNDFIQLEIDPVVGYQGDDAALLAQKEAVIAKVREVLVALRDHYHVRQDQIKHSSLMETSCGDDIDLRRYQIGDVDPVDPPVENPPVPPVPDDPGTTEPPTTGGGGGTPTTQSLPVWARWLVAAITVAAGGVYAVLRALGKIG